MTVKFPCPECGVERAKLEGRCQNCGWTPDRLCSVQEIPDSPTQKRTSLLVSVLSELDWEHPASKSPPWATHCRVYTGILACCAVSLLCWHYVFPNTFWFEKLWAASTTGGALGTGIGYWWQLANSQRRAGSSGWFFVLGVVGWGFFALISIFILGPDLAGQEHELEKIRALKNAAVLEVRVFGGDLRPQLTDHPAVIEPFKKLAGQARLFHPSHEGSLEEFEISVRLADGTVLSYHGRVPEKHPHDFSIDCRSYFWHEIRFPIGASWLDAFRRQLRSST